MPRVIWKGAISFGLVNIPIGLYPATKGSGLSFTMLDRRDMAPVGYKRINKTSGKEVPWEEIVKGRNTKTASTSCSANPISSGRMSRRRRQSNS